MAVIFLSALIFLFSFSPTIASDIQTYIVHVTQQESTVLAQEDRDAYYRSFLPFSIISIGERERLVHTYHNVISGFAARLTEEELKLMQAKDGFVSAKPEQKLKLQTTHSPNFLGLHVDMGYWKDSNSGKGVIIGMLDSGIFPSHPSFSDAGMPPPPAKWKGRCKFNVTDCNNKLIGARNFVTGEDSPTDDVGHGTHTSSTAAGAFVKNAEVLKNAYGTASGMAPWAHLAVYKVCSITDCAESDILAGIDSAVEDGVDVLSVSIAGTNSPFSLDSIAIGSFGAIQKGIFVSCGAGNDGPFNSTISNEAPWMLTVGASTMDRTFRATAKLGNNEEFDGESLFQPENFPSTLMPLVYAGTNSKPYSTFCGEGALEGLNVKGKIVLCERGGDSGVDKGLNVVKAGGAAMILMNDRTSGFSTRAEPHVLPASQVSFADGVKIKAYINSSSAPMATVVFKGTIIGSGSSPAVTSFSSRGPSIRSPGILKPDIIGPGVNILAAWPFFLDNSTSKSMFNIISGTSMSTPHLSGIAALIKSSHPDWSPAAIKSAMMTTADLHNFEGKRILDQLLEPADLFATGAGHVNPSKANDPGLVYDIQPSDYLPYLCGLGYTDKEVTVIAHRTVVKCADISSISEGDLNYPSFSVKFGDAQKFNRTVTNVGEAVSSYKVQISAPNGVEVTVEPERLSFSEVNQKLTYTVSFVQIVDGGDLKVPYAQGFLKWESASHSVRSPISVTFA